MHPDIKRDIDQKVRDGLLSTKDSRLLLKYLAERQSTRGLEPTSILAEYQCLTPWAEFLTFSEATIDDIYQAKAAMDGKGHKQNTLRHYTQRLKRFYEWMHENGHPLDLTKLNKIRVPGMDRITKDAAGMLSEDEIKRIIEKCGRVRDRAFFAMLYEGGFRPVELVRLCWKDIKFDEFGAVVSPSAKTKRPRYVRLISSVPYLASWRTEHPLGAREEDPVFVILPKPHTRLEYLGMTPVLKRAVRLAGITKHVTLYTFRHSRVTNMLDQEIPESVIKLQHWGSLSSTMLSTYGHMSNRSQDDILLKHAGVKRGRPKGPAAMSPRQCERCQTINAPTARFCSHCGIPLTEEAQKEVTTSAADIKKLLVENPNVQAVFMEILNQMKNQSGERQLTK
jgi:integrase